VIGVDSLTLPNLMSQQKIFPEIVSVGNPQPAVEFLTESIDAMLVDEFYFQKTCSQLDELCDQYAKSGASRRAADWIAQRLGRCGRQESLARRAA
jgi:lipid-A-disaccharide synthase